MENVALWLLYLYSLLTSCKKSEKSLEPFLRKLRYQPTNQLIITNNTDLIGPRWRRYIKSVILNYSLNTLVGKLSLIIVLERFFITLNSSTAKLWMFLWWIETDVSFLSKSLRATVISIKNFSVLWHCIKPFVRPGNSELRENLL